MTDGVRLLPAPGHSPAHVAVEIGDHGGLLFAVDALLHPLQVEHPEWGRGLDHDPELAIESRRSLLARAAGRGTSSRGRTGTPPSRCDDGAPRVKCLTFRP